LGSLQIYETVSDRSTFRRKFLQGFSVGNNWIHSTAKTQRSDLLMLPRPTRNFNPSNNSESDAQRCFNARDFLTMQFQRDAQSSNPHLPSLAFTEMDSRKDSVPRPRLRVNPAVTSQRIGDDAVLIDLRTNEIYEMNRTASRMWQLLGDGLDVDEIGSRLEAEFDIETADLHQQIDSFLTTLLDAKLVERE
jgi:hypothetical protein